jgi:very-short-patch-repair endonuclease
LDQIQVRVLQFSIKSCRIHLEIDGKDFGFLTFQDQIRLEIHLQWGYYHMKKSNHSIFVSDNTIQSSCRISVTASQDED